MMTNEINEKYCSHKIETKWNMKLWRSPPHTLHADIFPTKPNMSEIVGNCREMLENVGNLKN